ncbi:MAG: hypothetical protein J0L61_05915 [Planctomycetes bacterium]|nr:hypothetical protein [Planctomycetota bacterium]
MAQPLGMSMPGSQRGRRATPNVYTGLMAVAVVALLSACVVVWMNGRVIGPGGDLMSALSIHPKQGNLNLGR